MSFPARPAERLALRLLRVADSACNPLYGWRGNPLYQSGAIAVALLLVLIVTGLWLLLFYRIGTPYASVARITADPWVGQWMRGVHRYASDAAVVAVAVHAFRMYAQGRSWGPRALAWVSGVVLLGLVFVCGFTGYVMVWDTFGHLLAREGARMLDALPIFSEPIGRAFAGDEELLGPFFFIILFAHIALPLGMALVLWLHVARVARPTLLPPRRLAVVGLSLMVGVAVLWPLRMQPAANNFHLPASVEGDLFFAFLLPLTTRLSGGVAFALVVALGVGLMLVPMLTRRRGTAEPPKSVVDEDVCVGCRQCALDCPYEAIEMIERPPGGRSLEVARVDPALCVSCGICAGSCGPMAVGPAERTGRNQLARLRASMAEGVVAPGRMVVVGCDRVIAGWGRALETEGALLYPVDCAGSMHTSVVELLVRGGATGVLVLSCPPRDCWNREGPRWLVDRMFHEREAELKGRVDRRRVHVAHAAAYDIPAARAALRVLAARTNALDRATAEPEVELDLLCEPVTGTEET